MINDPIRWLIVISGPTASGKTSLAVSIAQHYKTSVISADSRQFYREMRIGTARPSAEEMGGIRHYLSGTLSITENYNISWFEKDVLKILDDLFPANPVVVMAGGSGLYINAVCHGLDELPETDKYIRTMLIRLYEKEGITALQNQLAEMDPGYYSQVDRQNPNRLIRALEVCMTAGIPYSALRKNKKIQRPFNILKIGMNLPKELLNLRINERVDEMIKNGLEKEARDLYGRRELNALNTVGYRELFEYFDGETTLNSAIEKIKVNTRRYAKRQLTWFRKDREITWFHPNDLSLILKFLYKTCQY